MKRSPKTKVLFVLMALVTLLVPIVTTKAQAPAIPAGARLPLGPVTGDAVNGKALFVANTCFGCHGFNGETGTRLAGIPSTNLANETNFIRFLRLRADQAPLTPATRMPNFPENTLSDKQAKDIYAYIRSFKATARELKDIPTLNQIIAAAARPYKP